MTDIYVSVIIHSS